MMVEQMTAHGDKAHRPTNKPPIRCLQRLLFFRNEKIMFMLLGFEKMFVSLQCTEMCRDRVCDRVPPTGHRGVSHFYFTSFSMFSSMMQKNIRPEYFLLASANASTNFLSGLGNSKITLLVIFHHIAINKNTRQLEIQRLPGMNIASLGIISKSCKYFAIYFCFFVCSYVTYYFDFEDLVTKST